jgi:glucose/arabinose dehydrogenase
VRGRGALALALAATAVVGGRAGVLGAQTTPPSGQPATEVVVDGAAFPTNMAFAPDGRLFYDEKETGNVRIVKDGRLLPEPFATLPVQGGGESGLLGLALDPEFGSNPYVYVYYTSSEDGRNHLARIRSVEGDPDRGGPPENLLTLLEASGIHNGGDIVFGQDGKLYVVAGETGDDTLAQDLNSLGGKVLRLNPDGGVPPDNPFGADSPVYSYGHRNSFGLCVNPHNGNLWETENGPSSDDEVNRIQAGGNYGWPEHLGVSGDDRFVDPVLVFQTIIVPTGCAFFDGALSSTAAQPVPGGQLVFGDFHGGLHSVLLRPPDFTGVSRERTEATFPGGITDVEVGPDGNLYVATSDSIVRVAAGQGVPFSPGGSTLPPTGGQPAPGESGGGMGTWAIVVIVGAAVLVIEGTLLWLVRRRRRGATPPA